MTIVTDNEVERVAKAIGDELPNLANGTAIQLRLARAALAASDRDVLVAELDIAKLAEQCAVACRREPFPSTATFETRIEEVLRAALTPLGGDGLTSAAPSQDPVSPPSTQP